MQDPFRERGTRSAGLTAAVNLFWAVGTASAMIAPVLGLMWAGPPSEAPAPEGPPGSGIVLRTDVIAMDRSLEKLWYALTYRGHQVNGESGEITQIRRLSGVADHLDELQAVMATAAGRPPRFEGPDLSHARVEVIPDTLQGVDPHEAVIRLMAEPDVRDRSSPTGGLDSTRRTE